MVILKCNVQGENMQLVEGHQHAAHLETLHTVDVNFVAMELNHAPSSRLKFSLWNE